MVGLGGARAKGPAAPMREHFYSLGLRGVLGAFFFLILFLRKNNDKNFKADFSCYRKTNIKALPLSGSLWPCLCVLPARCWAQAWPPGRTQALQHLLTSRSQCRVQFWGPTESSHRKNSRDAGFR